MNDTQGSAGSRPDGEDYEIRLAGHLDRRWAEWFDGLSLSHRSDGTTVLRGPVADQAALHGLLQKVRDLALPLVSARQVARDQPDSPDPTPATSQTTNRSAS